MSITSYLTLLPREILQEVSHYVVWRPPRVIPLWEAEFTESQKDLLEFLCGGRTNITKRVLLSKRQFVEWIRHPENNNLFQLIRETKRAKLA